MAMFLAAFACNPSAMNWDPFIQDGRCLDMNVLNVAGCAINTVSDIAILILPQLAIWKLRMSIGRKIAVSSVFAIGIL